MPLEIIIKIISVLFGLIIGFLAYKTSTRSEVAGLLSILVGLTGTLVVNNLIEFFQQSRQLSRINANLSNLLIKIAKFHQSGWNLNQVLRYGVTTFKREQIPNVWIELLWQMESRYCGVSYSDPDLWWSQAFTKLASEIQKTKIIVNKADIRRVFIYKDEAEKERLQDIMREQYQSGIKVKYISQKSIEDNYLLKQLSGKIETFDFALIDAKIAWLVIVDKNRKFKAGKALIDETLTENYRSFFDHLFAEAAQFEG
jgi:uncharacterized membrane protein YeaQ/YmgE (transglycosylase-associated protein family)